MKDKKKIFIICGIILLLIVVGVVIFFLCNNKKQESVQPDDTKQEVKTYEMYVKINPLVKLVFNTSFKECEDPDGNKEVCGGGIDTVVDYELVNNDAKEIYNDLDFYGMNILDVLVELCDTARANGIGFEKLDITSDYNNINKDEIAMYLKEHSKYDTQVSINVDFKEYINKDDLLTEEEKQEEKLFSVIFNTDGGTKISSQVLHEGEKVKKPEDPKKQGYNFVEWRFNNNKYDFDQVVTEDIKLKAVWERNNDPTTTTTTKSTTTKKTTTTTADPFTSTLSKINLNENFMVTIMYPGTACSELAFATNYDTVFADVLRDHPYEDYKWEEILGNQEYNNRMNSLTFDSSKEETAKTILAQSKSSPAIGVIDFEYGVDGHFFTYSYKMITLESPKNYGKFGKDYDAQQDSFYNKISKAFSSSKLFNGGCGSMPDPPTLLTEELCSEFKLNCARW